MASDAFDLLSRNGGAAAYTGTSVKDGFNADGRLHDIRRPHDPRLVPLTIAGGLVAVLAALCVSLLVYTLVVGPVASLGLFSGTGDDAQSLTDNRGAVQLPVYASGLDSRGSRIPVHVTGTLADGTAYDKHTYVSHDGSGLKVDPGHYDMVIEQSPISSGGVLYTVPDGVTTVDVGEDGSVDYVSSASLIFSEIAALSVGDDQIEAARVYIANDPERNMYADSLAERARTRRSDAQAEVEKAKAEAAAQQQAAAVAAEKIAQQESSAAEQAAKSSTDQENTSSTSESSTGENSSGTDPSQSEESSSTGGSGTSSSSENSGSSSTSEGSGTGSGGESGTGSGGESGTGTGGTSDTGTGGTSGTGTGGTSETIVTETATTKQADTTGMDA